MSHSLKAGTIAMLLLALAGLVSLSYSAYACPTLRFLLWLHEGDEAAY
jgi:hypothetical protein